MPTPPEIQALRMLLPPAGVAFDVGANRGEWTSAALQISPGIVVHAFEPSIAFQQLRLRLAPSIAAGCVIARPEALGESIATKTFHQYDDATDWSTFHRRGALEMQHNLIPREIEVAVSTVDEYCRGNGIERIDFLKIDTEGYELAVLKGATSLLAASRIECIQFEYGGTYADAGITLREVFEFLMSFDYTLLKMQTDRFPHRPQFLPADEDFQFANYLALPNRRVEVR